jgi:tRNA threonylcarbamoyladenosine biosynthesis protein TsaE
MLELELTSEQQQMAFGAQLAAACEAPCVIYLEGDLGSGKTTLTRGFIRAMGHHGAVKSPTYTLLEPYPLGQVVCYHLDLFRLAAADELEYLGLRDLLDERAVMLVEWPEKGLGVLPPADLLIELSYCDAGRRIRLQGKSAKGRMLIQRFNGVD